MEYYSALKRNEILKHATTWVILEIITLLREVRHEKTVTVWFHFSELPGIDKFTETESRAVGIQGWELQSSGDKVSVWKDEIILEMEVMVLYNSVNTMPLNWTLKMFKMINVISSIFICITVVVWKK